MGILITALIILLIISIISIASIDYSDGDSLWLLAICLFIGWMMVINKTTSYDEPVEVSMSKISILIDDEVAIIRYSGDMKTYESVREYQAIKDSSFVLMKTNERNVLGNHVGDTWELIVK